MARLLNANKAPEKPRSEALSEYISEALQREGITINDAAVRWDVTYEHARRVIRGESIPSRVLLRRIVDDLELDMKQAERLAVFDRLNNKHDGIPMELAGKDPSLAPLERIWSKLKPSQQQDILHLAKSWVKVNQVEAVNA